jgi:PilZ domain
MPLATFIPFFLAVGSAQAASTEEIVRQLSSGFGKFNPLMVILFGGAIIAMTGVFVLLEIRNSNRKRREFIAIGWQYFEETSAVKGLIPNEKEMLRNIVNVGLISSADMIFESASIYDECLEEWLKLQGAKLQKEESVWAVLHGIRMKLGYAKLPSEVPLTSTRQFQEGSPAVVKVTSDLQIKGSVLEVTEKAWIVACDDLEPLGGRAEIEAHVLRGGDAEYVVRVPVLGLRHGAGTLQLGHTRDLLRKQLRSWVRIDVNIPCRVTILSGPENQDEGEMGLPTGLVLEGRLMDLSGGGTCARFSSPIPQGHKLSLNFDLPGASLRGIEATVIRMAPSRKNGREDFEHNVKFSGIETSLQEKIVRYIFDKHRLDTQTRQTRGPNAVTPG